MKTAPAFHVYVLGKLDQLGLTKLLAELGLEGEPLNDPGRVIHPAVILVGPGQEAPAGLTDITIAPPVDASPSALREMLRVAMEHVTLQRHVTQLEEQATRQQRQLAELHCIGIAPFVQTDIVE